MYVSWRGELDTLRVVTARSTYAASNVEDNTLDAFVKSLRHKIDLPGASRLIHTIRGVGYSLREDPGA